jgi:hypothetical protein
MLTKPIDRSSLPIGKYILTVVVKLLVPSSCRASEGFLRVTEVTLLFDDRWLRADQE